LWLYQVLCDFPFWRRWKGEEDWGSGFGWSQRSKEMDKYHRAEGWPGSRIHNTPKKRLLQGTVAKNSVYLAFFFKENRGYVYLSIWHFFKENRGYVYLGYGHSQPVNVFLNKLVFLLDAKNSLSGIFFEKNRGYFYLRYGHSD
jgi:hypothetical protein